MINATLETYIHTFITVINRTLIPAIFALAFLVFIFYVYKFFIANGAADREKGRTFVLWSVIGFGVMISIWGIVNVLINTFGFGYGQSRPNLPTFGDAPSQNSSGTYVNTTFDTVAP